MDGTVNRDDNSGKEEAAVPEKQLEEITASISHLEELLEANNRVLSDMNKKYHNEFAGVISRQQAELDMFREGLGRNAVNNLLKTIAVMYGDYEKYAEYDDIDKVKSGFCSLLDDMLQLMHESGVEEYKSVEGEKYSVRFSKPVEKIKTGERELHATVIESRSTGFYSDKTVLVPERVKIYVYDEAYAENKSEEN